MTWVSKWWHGQRCPQSQGSAKRGKGQAKEQPRRSWGVSLPQLCSLGILRKCSAMLSLALSMKIQYFWARFPATYPRGSPLMKEGGSGTPRALSAGRPVLPALLTGVEGITAWGSRVGEEKNTRPKVQPQGRGREELDVRALQEVKQERTRAPGSALILTFRVLTIFSLQLHHAEDSKTSLLLAPNHTNSQNDTTNAATF